MLIDLVFLLINFNVDFEAKFTHYKFAGKTV
jgi:hypothetical protein